MAEEQGRPLSTAGVDEAWSAHGALHELNRLPMEEQLAVLRSVAPRVLGHLLETAREQFLAAVRSAPAGPPKPPSARQTEAQGPLPAPKVAAAILARPLEEQLQILRLAAARVASELEADDRERFVESLDEAVYKA